MKNHVLIVAALTLGLHSSPSLGQNLPGCQPGQIVTAETQGQCCWLGQVWSARSNSCRGIPECPAGMSAQGETCVDAAGPAVVVPSQPQPLPRRQYAQPQPAWGYVAPGGWAAPGPAPVLTRATRRPLLGLGIAGTVVFGLGYLSSIVMGITHHSGGSSCDAAANWFFVPLFGAAVAGPVYEGISVYNSSSSYSSYGGYYSSCPDSSGTAAFGVLNSTAQILGLTGMIIGFAVRRSVPIGPAPRGAVDRRPVFYASPNLDNTGFGATLGLVHF